MSTETQKIRSRLKQIYDKRKRFQAELSRNAYRAELIEKKLWEYSANAMLPNCFVNQSDEKTKEYILGIHTAFETDRTCPTDSPITALLIRDLHRQFFTTEEAADGGNYRQLRASWLNSTMIFSNPAKIPYIMDNITFGVENYQVPAFYWDEKPDENYQKLSYDHVIQAFDVNYGMISTHPFNDGNKRISRLITSLMLTRQGHVPLIEFDKPRYVKGVESYFNTRTPFEFYLAMFADLSKSYDRSFEIITQMDSLPSKQRPVIKNEILKRKQRQ